MRRQEKNEDEQSVSKSTLSKKINKLNEKDNRKAN
jgi:hypothetical protein